MFGIRFRGLLDPDPDFLGHISSPNYKVLLLYKNLKISSPDEYPQRDRQHRRRDPTQTDGSSRCEDLALFCSALTELSRQTAAAHRQAAYTAHIMEPAGVTAAESLTQSFYLNSSSILHSPSLYARLAAQPILTLS